MATKKSFKKILGNEVIRYFRADKEKVMANETILLEWEVENARKVRLDGVEQNTTFSKTFINTAHSFRLSAYGLYGRSTEYLPVALHKPQILLFEPDSNELTEGMPINISFRIRFGLNWKLIAEYNGRLNGEKEQLGTGIIADGYTTTEKSIQIQLKDTATLRLQVRNGSEMTTETISLDKKNVSVIIDVDRDKAVSGAIVRVTWESPNAKELWLNPGHINLIGLSHYDVLITGDRDVQLEIIASGDFGGFAKATRTILLAKINSFSTSNNGDPNFPEFFLNWFTIRFWQLRLLPENVPVADVEDRYPILSSGPDSYTLVGVTRQQEEVSSTIQLSRCNIGNFELEAGKAMIGTNARLRWSVNGAKSLQLRFTGDLLPIDLSPGDTQHVFQVFKERESVTLIAWGDLNVMTISLPIPRFIGPEIKTINMPTLDIRLGINWVPSPKVNKVRLLALIQTLRRRGGSSTHFAGLWQWLVIYPRPTGTINILKSIKNGTAKFRNTNK